jgi:hypothetical protein
MAYNQIGGIIFLVEARFESPYFDIETALMYNPFNVRGPELIYPGITTLNDDVRVAFLTKSAQHGLREGCLDERIESG